MDTGGRINVPFIYVKDVSTTSIHPYGRLIITYGRLIIYAKSKHVSNNMCCTTVVLSFASPSRGVVFLKLHYYLARSQRSIHHI